MTLNNSVMPPIKKIRINTTRMLAASHAPSLVITAIVVFIFIAAITGSPLRV
jgi:hypothetical protein